MGRNKKWKYRIDEKRRGENSRRKNEEEEEERREEETRGQMVGRLGVGNIHP